MLTSHISQSGATPVTASINMKVGSLLGDAAHIGAGLSLEGGSTVPSVARFSVVNTQVSNSIDSLAAYQSKGNLGGGFGGLFGS